MTELSVHRGTVHAGHRDGGYSTRADSELVEKYGDLLVRKPPVDMSDALNPDKDGFITPSNSSAAEEIAKMVRSSVSAMKACNTTCVAPLATGEAGGLPLIRQVSWIINPAIDRGLL